MNIDVVADTGYIVALANNRDRHHHECLRIHQLQRIIWLPQTVLAEVSYMLTRERGQLMMTKFVLELPITKYRLLALDSADVIRAGELLLQYKGTRLDFVDASVIALAERLHITRILTLDKRDFGMVRPQHVEIFELLP
jgi:predicted nucleic acid-binding protein